MLYFYLNRFLLSGLFSFYRGRENQNQVYHTSSFSVFDQGYYMKSSVMTDYVITIK